MQHSILYLFNSKNFLKIRNKSTQTKINIFSDFCNLKKLTKTKQKQISKIEKTNILIENPKTQIKKESNLNLPNKKIQLKLPFYTQTYKLRKKLYYYRCRFQRYDGLNLARERTVVRIVFTVWCKGPTNSALIPFWL